jgi:hypothetical protein
MRGLLAVGPLYTGAVNRVALLLAVLGACVRSGEVTCGDGRLCPPGYTCDELNMRCLSAEQVAACSGRGEGAECTVAGAPGACRMGACEALVCGDGIRSVGEACDGIDFGTATCKDAGYYDEAGLACTEFCTFDVSACTGFCGDSMINGLELCDGAPPPGACVDYGFDAGAVGCGGSCGISFDSCARFGWVPEATTLVHALTMDARSPSDIWVGGDSNLGDAVARFDGNAWSVQPLAAGSPPHAIAAAGPDDAWLIRGTTTPTLEHVVSNVWSPVTGVPPAIYRDIWAAGPSAIFVATDDAGVLAWDGTSWSTLGTLADPLTTIDGSRADDIWVATTTGALHHWTGTAWVPVVVDIDVKRIQVEGPDDVWVIGPSLLQTDAYAMGHWDGLNWSITVDPSINPQVGRKISAIAAAAPNDVWIATPSGTAKHFDGTQLSPAGVVVVNQAFSTFSELKAFPGTTVGISFDGYFYRYRGQLYARFNTGSITRLVASASITPANTIAIDNKNTAYRFDGTTWNQESIDNVTPSRSNRSLWARAADDIWVGGTGGRLFHYDGASWSTSPYSDIQTYNAILGFAADDIWFFGSSAVHYNGSSYDPNTLTGNTSLSKASASGPNDIWALGISTTGTNIYHFDGAAWTASQLSDTLTAIVALAPDNVFATAANRIWHWNGTSWSSQFLPVIDSFVALSATGPTDVFAATASQILHFDGERWTFIRAPGDLNVANRPITNIAALPDRVDLVYDQTVGNVPMRRLIRTRPWNCAATETACGDGVDNDCDTRVDTLDSGCP